MQPNYLPRPPFADVLRLIIGSLFTGRHLDTDLSEYVGDIVPETAHRVVEYMNYLAQEMACEYGHDGACVIGIRRPSNYNLPIFRDGLFGIYIKFQAQGRPAICATFAPGEGLRVFSCPA